MFKVTQQGNGGTEIWTPKDFKSVVLLSLGPRVDEEPESEKGEGPHPVPPVSPRRSWGQNPECSFSGESSGGWRGWGGGLRAGHLDPVPGHPDSVGGGGPGRVPYAPVPTWFFPCSVP